jgi:hypothetical protein
MLALLCLLRSIFFEISSDRACFLASIIKYFPFPPLLFPCPRISISIHHRHSPSSTLSSQLSVHFVQDGKQRLDGQMRLRETRETAPGQSSDEAENDDEDAVLFGIFALSLFRVFLLE